MKLQKRATGLLTAGIMMMSAFSAIPTSAATTNLYVSTKGSDSNAGTSSSAAFKTLTKALSQASAGTTIYVLDGTYSYDSTFKLSKSGTSSAPIKIVAKSGQPVIDFSSQSYSDSSRGFQISGNYWTIDGLKIVGAGDNGIYISGSNNKIQNCEVTKCRDTGVQLSNGASNNKITSVTSTYNYDPKTDGENADGFAAKLSVGSGNVFTDCHAYYNSDDGYDLYNATNAVKFYDCEASYNGTNSGNGQGFKVGGNYTADKHYLEDCVAIGNKARGYDQNNNTGAITLVNCTGKNNGVNFYFPKAPASGSHKFTNCTSISGKSKDKVVGTKSGCSFNE